MTTVNAQKYSQALLEVAQKHDQLESVLDEVRELTQVVETNHLAAFFGNAVYSEADKVQILETLRSSSSELVRNFLDTLHVNGRLSSLEDILDEVKNQADDLFQISDVEVVSAVPLTDAQLAKTAVLAKDKFSLKDATLHNHVDEKILGGFVLHSRGKVIDASVKTQLTKIAASIT